MVPDGELVEEMGCGEEWGKCYVELDCDLDHRVEL